MFSRRTAWKLTPNRLSQTEQEVKAAGRTLLDLTASNPTRVGLSFDAQAVIGALADARSLDYDPQPRGLLSAREAIAAYYRDRACLRPEALVLTTSTSEGYSHLFRLLCDPEDEVLIPRPSYPLFEFLADLQDVKLVAYPLLYDHGWQIDFASLEKSANSRTRAVVVVHPNNPTGSYVREQERDTLNRFCHAHGLALIADEVFLDYALDGKARSSFAGNSETLTFVLSGISKISALPQMKLAWIAASGPPDRINSALQRLEIIADTFLSMNAPIQLATSVLLEQRRRVQPLLLERVRINLTELDRQLAGQKPCTRLQVEGGWYAVLRVPATQSDEDLAVRLLREQSVLIHPGHFYDFPSDGYVVVSLITSPQTFQEGVKRMLKLLVD
jgi:aspartate/methionine/tyrosine aminotransferase